MALFDNDEFARISSLTGGSNIDVADLESWYSSIGASISKTGALDEHDYTAITEINATTKVFDHASNLNAFTKAFVRNNTNPTTPIAPVGLNTIQS